MQYFKNVEAARIYHVSEKSIRNWIESAKNGKLDLELREHRGKYYIGNTAQNQALINKMVERGQKYKNTRGHKIVSPKPDFYDQYSPQQIFNIFSSLDIHREIPLQYTYFKEGAEHFDLYAQRLLNEETANTLTATINLLHLSLDYINEQLGPHTNVNIIDLGVGNALPVRELLEYFIEKGRLKRYVGIDISDDMLKIAHKNIEEWYGEKINFEKYIKDFSYENFENLLAEDAFSGDTANIVLFLGGTLSNMKAPSRVLGLIHDSMTRNDIFIHSQKIDTPKARRYFDFSVQPNKSKNHKQNRKLDDIFETVVRMLNIPEDFYKVEYVFDEKQKARLIYIVLSVDIVIKFKLGGIERSVSLNKDEKVIVYRVRHVDLSQIVKEFEGAEFDLLHTSKTPDQEYLLTISKVKTLNAYRPV